MTAELQLALDGTDLGAAEVVVRAVSGRARRIEVGTPLLLAVGLPAVGRVRELAPDAVVVADTKICDAGARIAASAYAAGADVVTVVAAAIDEPTWGGVVTAASMSDRPDARVLIDAIGWTVDLGRLTSWSASAAAVGVAVEICVHRPKEGSLPLDRLIDEVRIPESAHYAVAGRITATDVQPALEAGFSTLIVGGAVAEAADPAAEWSRLSTELDAWTHRTA